jgi:hypothetical protein
MIFGTEEKGDETVVIECDDENVDGKNSIIPRSLVARLTVCQTSRWQGGGVPQAEPSTSAKGHLADRIFVSICISSLHR